MFPGISLVDAPGRSVSANSPNPLGPTRLSGFFKRAGEYWFMMPAEPLAQSTPLFTGWLELPWM